MLCSPVFPIAGLEHGLLGSVVSAGCLFLLKEVTQRCNVELCDMAQGYLWDGFGARALHMGTEGNGMDLD